MDLAPALPPSQDALPVLASSTAPGIDSDIDLETSSTLQASTLQAPVLPESTPPATRLSLSWSSFIARFPILGSAANIPAPTVVTPAVVTEAVATTSFVPVADLVSSFDFVGQAFRTARLGHVFGKPLYSSTLSLQQVSQSSWRPRALAADISVKRIEAPAQTIPVDQVVQGTQSVQMQQVPQIEQVPQIDQVPQSENRPWTAAFIEQCMPGETRSLQSGVRYRISIGDKTLGYVADENRAYLLAQQLKRLIRQASFEPDAIAAYPLSDSLAVSIPAVSTKDASDATAVVGTPDQPLFTIDASMSTEVGYSPDWAAVSWANNLRSALEASPLLPGEALMHLKGLEPSTLEMAGEASWYGPYFHGRATANGETYDQYALTVAHKSLPFGTQLKVRNLLNDKTVVVRVNDRGPYVGDRILDLSRAAADCLGSDQAGVIPVEATVLRNAK